MTAFYDQQPPTTHEQDIAFIRAYSDLLNSIAKEGYEQYGRGAVLVEQDRDTSRIAYLSRSRLLTIIDPNEAGALLEKIASYRPASDFVCIMVSRNSTARVYFSCKVRQDSAVSWRHPLTV